jgi:aminopeptidase-like protein
MTLPDPCAIKHDFSNAGDFCHRLATHWFPVCRSLTGEGVRDTLKDIKTLLPDLQLREVPSGTSAFDWIVPEEWNIRDAHVENEAGQRVIDFREHNLHVVGYSEPVDAQFELAQLQEHLHSLPEQPDAIPYVTSYYKRNWGFCLRHRDREKLRAGSYRVVIDSDLRPGVLNHADLLISGGSEKEVLLSTYVCHPSMANNELSGPTVACALALWLQSLPRRRYSYRFVFVPETIGSLVYLSQNLAALKKNVVAGYVLTCLGDERCYSFQPSRAGNTLADRAGLHALGEIDPDFKRYTWLDRGSDERQYCAPGVDLPVALVMRSKFYEYPEYHTSLDDLTFVTPAGLQGGFDALRRCIAILEANVTPRIGVLGEPQLGRRGLYPNTSTKDTFERVKCMMDAISCCDGSNDLLAISQRIGQPFDRTAEALAPLIENGLITISE